MKVINIQCISWAILLQLFLSFTLWAQGTTTKVVDIIWDKKNTSFNRQEIKSYHLEKKEYNLFTKLKDDEAQLQRAIELLWDQVSNLYSADSLTQESAIDTVTTEFQKIINNFPDSDLKDDAQLFIGRAVGYSKDGTRTRAELQKLIDNFPNGTFCAITLDSDWFDSNVGIKNWWSTSVETDAFAQLFIANTYWDPNYFPNDVSSLLTIEEAKKLTENYPFSPFAPAAQFLIGEVYNGERERFLAKDEYQKVLENYPNNLFYVGSSYERIGAMMAAISEWDIIEQYAKEIAERFSGSNYLAECRFGKFLHQRWSDPLTLTLYAHRENYSPLTPEDSSIVDSTITIFETALGGIVNFQIVSEPSEGDNLYNQVDYEVIFMNSSIAGWAQISSELIEPVGNIQRVIVQLGANRLYNDRLKTAIHEFGHGLGLGHSFNNEDVMFYSTSQVPTPQLSNRDINTIKLLYSGTVVSEYAPRFMGLPDTTINEDDSLHIDLDNFVTDIDNIDNELNFSSTNNFNISVSINSITHIATLIPISNWSGTEEIVFQVMDLTGQTDTDTLSIIVLPVNDAPIISNIADTSFAEDDSLSFDLDDYVDDVDDPDSALTWDISLLEGEGVLLSVGYHSGGFKKSYRIERKYLSENYIKLKSKVSILNDELLVNPFSSNGGIRTYRTMKPLEDSITVIIDPSTHIVTFTATENYFVENVPFLFTVTDYSGATDSDTMRITVIPVNDPPILSAVPDTSFNEDEQLSFPISYLYDFVFDPDNADSTLTWSLSDTDYVHVAINEDTVFLSAEKDWFGKDTLKILVNDSELSDTTFFIIKVNPVNDAPYFTELMPDSILFDSNVSDTLHLTDLASDIDNPNSLLKWSYIYSSFVSCYINDSMKYAVFWVEDNISGQDTVVLSVCDGELSIYDSLIVIVNHVSGIDHLMSQIPKEYSLSQNFPNPFNPTTNIIYGIPKHSHVSIKIYDLLGREVITLVDENQEANYYKILWNARNRFGNNISSGVYFYRIVAESGDRVFVKTKKLLLLR